MRVGHATGPLSDQNARARHALPCPRQTNGWAIRPSAAPESRSLMRLPFIPREEAFFDFFVEDAQNVLTAARLLVEFFESYDQRERIASQLIDLEHKGDAISH